jgi:hypothetical protein
MTVVGLAKDKFCMAIGSEKLCQYTFNVYAVKSKELGE